MAKAKKKTQMERWLAPRKRFAAIGTDGTRPVVWGLGWSPGLARLDAESFDKNWDSNGGFTVEVSEEIAERVIAGEVSCDAIGIAVKMRDGKVVAP